VLAVTRRGSIRWAAHRYKKERSVAFKIRQIRFWPGLRAGLRWGAHDARPDPLVGWGLGKGTPLPIPHRSCAFGAPQCSRLWR